MIEDLGNNKYRYNDEIIYAPNYATAERRFNIRKPTLEDFDNGDGTHDTEGYYDAMDNYADESRDDLIEQQWIKEEDETPTDKPRQ